jgi:hypothetical protein
MLAVIVRWPVPGTAIRSARSASSRSPATCSAVCRVARGSSAANSSPPSRASTSDSRSRARRTVATRAITWSPAAWPRVSLMYLKWSRSSSTSAPSEP